MLRNICHVHDSRCKREEKVESDHVHISKRSLHTSRAEVLLKKQDRKWRDGRNHFLRLNEWEFLELQDEEGRERTIRTTDRYYSSSDFSRHRLLMMDCDSKEIPPLTSLDLHSLKKKLLSSEDSREVSLMNAWLNILKGHSLNQQQRQTKTIHKMVEYTQLCVKTTASQINTCLPDNISNAFLPLFDPQPSII